MTKLTLIDDAVPSDQFQHGGQPLNQLILLLTGEPLDTEEDIRINTTFKFYSGKLALFDDDPLLTHKLYIKLENITSGLDKSVTFRNPTVQDDFFVTESQNQILYNKTLSTNIQVTSDIQFNNNSLLNATLDSAEGNVFLNVPGSSITNGSITTTKIADGNVTDVKIATVAFSKVSGQIAMSQITDNSITNAKLVQITDASKIADSLITSAKIANDTIVDIDISTSANISPVKVRDVRKDTTVEKSGSWDCMSKWELDVSGIFKDMQYVGNFSTSSGLDAGGDSQWFATGVTGANTWAGTYIINPVGTFAGWTRPGLLPHIRFRLFIPLRSSGDVVFIFGFWTGEDFPAIADGNPLTVNNGGILVGWDSDDTNIQLYVGTGNGSTAPSSPVDTGVPVPTASGVNRIIDIQFTTSTTVVVKILDSSTLAEIYNSGSITTNIPVAAKSLNFINLIRNPTNINKTIVCYSAWGTVKA